LQYSILASYCLRTIYYTFRQHNSCTNWIKFSLYNMFRPLRPSDKLYYINTLLSCYYSPILGNVYNFLKGKVICVYVLYNVNTRCNSRTSLNIRLKLMLILNKMIKCKK
jgi:hypothetical protein